MKKAILPLMVLAVLAQLAGCVSSSDRGTIRVSWSITANGAAASCAQVGGATVRIIVDEGGEERATVNRPCEDRAVDIEIDSGTYEVTVDLFDAGGTQLNQVPFVMTADVRSGRTTNIGNLEFAFDLNGAATFSVQWGSSNESCASGGIVLEEVRISTGGQCLDADLLVGGDTQATCTQYTCAPGNVQRVVQDLPPANYLIQVVGYKGAVSATPYACYYSDAVACNGGDCDLGTLTAIFNPLPQDEQFCNATKPQESKEI